jgi:hypothetical protein
VNEPDIFVPSPPLLSSLFVLYVQGLTLPPSPLLIATMDDRLSGFVMNNNYQVLDVIGEGAYGIVWCVIACLHLDGFLLTFLSV